ncbi:relaxase [Streptococcus pneumoniae]|uniref:Relaxase n=1 Tax=Streptococcus pneumoniae TaxID=1313 RepID=A0AA95IH85_STREE|nr:relaxase [Streptococcus pneumoniae]COH08810.1 relaxase [Streptococcus pneumoniae]COK19622.1 relaxase [Streptococcus pneumoniae]VIZ00339.1 relaxase [Streptococcus pneumoniae]VLL99733.1 relaxase [Streptococcus pneumoniae]
MTKPIRGRQLSKRDLYDEDFFKTYFAKQEIESRLKFLLKSVYSLEELHVKAKELNLTIELKQKNVMFTLEEDGKKISLSHKKLAIRNCTMFNFLIVILKIEKLEIFKH